MGTQSHIHTDVEFSALVYNATYRPEQVLVCMFGSTLNLFYKEHSDLVTS